MSPATLHLIDGHSQVFRAYHAISGGLSTSTGVPTNAVFGFLNGLRVLMQDEKPTHLLVVFDEGHDERTDLYPEYKTNRTEMPSDLEQQMELIHRALDAMGIPTLSLPGHEADDIIATIARQACEQGFRVSILSNDKDLFQLVCDQVTVLRTMPKDGIHRCDPAAVLEKMGVKPEQIADYLGLTGDSVDNIPGVPGVGAKTAAKLLAEHGDLEAVLAAAGAIKQPKLRSSLLENAEDARLSHRLALLNRNAEVTFDPERCAWCLKPNPALTALLKELEFGNLLQLWGEAPPCPDTASEAITSAAALREFVALAKRAGRFAIDTETTSVDEMSAGLVGISMACERGKAVYVPIGHTGLNGGSSGQIELGAVQEVLGPLLADSKLVKIGHNLKFDLKMLRRHGLPLVGPFFDSMVASFCLNPDKRAHGLKDLTAEHLCVTQRKISELIGTGKTQISFAEVSIDQATEYAGQDADLTLQLADILRGELEKAGLLDLYTNVEVPLIEVLADMEMAGVAIDPEHFAKLHTELLQKLKDLTREIHALAGHEFKINSPAQLRTVLFEELKLPTAKKGKTGHSTDVDVLESLCALHPLPEKILEHRQVEKLLSTYVETLPKLINHETGRIHTCFNQAGAATGRLSSSDPNLQNIPVRSELGRRIREGFKPRSRGNVLLAADYSQIELRVLAHLCEDEGLLETFRTGGDIHRATAARIHGIAPEDVTGAQREASKVVTFGVLYGISAHRLSTELKIPRAEAQQLINQFFESHPGIAAWIQETLHQAREQGFVTTLSGRRRFIADIKSPNFNLRSAAERIAVNTPVQGSAADMIKIAMRWMAERLCAEGLRAHMVLQVHDELIFDLPEEEADTLRPLVMETMAGAMPLAVPVIVDVAVGKCWAEC